MVSTLCSKYTFLNVHCFRPSTLKLREIKFGPVKKLGESGGKLHKPGGKSGEK